MAKNQVKRGFSILGLFFEREIDKWEKSLPLELRQKNIREMEAEELDQMIAASNNSAGQFSLMTAMYAEAQVEIQNLDSELKDNVAEEKTASGVELESIKRKSEMLAVSLTRSRARLAQLKQKIDQADNLDDRGKAMIYNRAAEMRDAAFNDKMDLIQDNMNQIQAGMNAAMKRQIEVLNKGDDFSGKRVEMHNEVASRTAEVENESEILSTLLDSQEQTKKAQRAAVDTDAATLLASLRGEPAKE